jgi:cysteinyl-tRNA synthetase
LLTKGFSPESIRYLLLSTHYRQQLNFTLKGLKATEKTIERVKGFVKRLNDIKVENSYGMITKLMVNFNIKFETAMNDDLNTPIALASFFDFIKDVNKLIDKNQLGRSEAQEILAIVKNFDRIFCFIGKVKQKGALSREVNNLIIRREEARKNRDWDTADKIRDKLREIGVLLEDTPKGVKWKIND